MSNAAKATIGSGPSGDPDAPRPSRPRGDLSLDDEVRRSVRVSKGYSSPPRFKNGGDYTLEDTIKRAVKAHSLTPDNEKI
jgi:hypothetical protein